jgi:DNA mismatch endonuclease (patch repair protein)
MTRPSASNDLVRRQMSRQRRVDTQPELDLRRELHGRGLRFRLHVRIGRITPDVVFTRAKIAVFVMGDFWHYCPLHGNLPRANAEWWAAKLAANRARDLRQRDELKSQGWWVEWVWECEDAVVAADRIAAVWRDRRRPVTEGGACASDSPAAGTRHVMK